MAVILQEYINDGHFSGVGFSVVQENNWDLVGLNVVAGLGGGVDGKQTPLSITINSKENIITDYQDSPDAHRSSISREDLSQPDEHTTIYRQLPIKLSKEKLLHISKVLKAIRKAYQQPVEIEFVISLDETYRGKHWPKYHSPEPDIILEKNMTLHIVQVRPITKYTQIPSAEEKIWENFSEELARLNSIIVAQEIPEFIDLNVQVLGKSA